MAKGDSDVLVVGAGPVGLFSALLLANRGVKVRIVDEQWRAAARSYALALHPRSLRLMQEAGLVDDLVARGRRVESIAFYDKEERMFELRLSELPVTFPFVLVIPQQALEEVLAQRLKSAGVPVLWNHRVAGLEIQGDICRTRVEELAKESTGYAVARTEWVVEGTWDFKSKFVLGCDGHRSTVRRSLGIDFQNLGGRRQYAVFEFTSQAAPSSEMAVVLYGKTTNVLWPMTEGRHRWSFELTDDEMTEPRVKKRLFVQVHEAGFPYAGRESLERFLHQRAAWFEPQIGEIAWSATVSFEKRLADKFGEGRCQLLGDAAHVAWPVGVQSMNVGLHEAHGVARLLDKVLRGAGSESLLQEFGWSQREHWKQLMRADDQVEALPEAGQWVRSHLDKFPSALPVSGKDLGTLLQKVGISWES